MSKNNIHVFYNTRESLYIPTAFAAKKDLYSQLLQLMLGEEEGWNVLSNEWEQQAITQIFRVPEELRTLVDSITNPQEPKHVNPIIAAQLQQDDILYCHVFYDHISVMLRKNGKWQIMQQFAYQTPEDISYHLINLCERHQMKVADTPLVLSGMITKESNLYQQLYNFYLNILFMPMAVEVELEESMKELPAHFITHLTYLAQCAS